MVSHSGLITVMTRAARKAAPRLRRDYNEVEQLQVSKKGPADFVSMADKRAEQTLIDELRFARPDWAILTEESGVIEGDPSKPRWIVDPLDGTTNFLHGVPHFSISIAVEEPLPGGKTGISHGLVYQPLTDETFWAEKGRGAWLNDRRLRVSARRDLNEAMISTGIPHFGRGDIARWSRIFGAIGPEVAGIRRMGSAALDLAWVAAGRFDGFWEDDLDIWDTAAGHPAGQGSRRVHQRLSRAGPDGRAARISGRQRRAAQQAAQAAGRGAAVILTAVAALALAAAPATVLTVDPSHRLIEGVASDGKTIWLSSLINRQILQCRKRCTTIATLPEGLHPFAIAWDRNRQRLWVAADCPPGVPFITACERGALIAFDRQGKVRTRISPFVGQFHPGDVSASNGEVFVSDSQNGMVFRLVSNDRAIMAVVLPGIGKSAQGTALDAGGSQLVVADYSQGIGITGLATFKRQLLPRPDGKPLRGIDGLARCGSNYYGLYNGASPGRLISFTIEGAGITVTDPDIQLPDPTQIAFDGKRLLVVADSGWEQAMKGVPRATGAPIVAIPLGKDCKPL